MGKDSAKDFLTWYQVKHLKIWGAALTLDEIMSWGITTLTSQGYPNLMLYYRFDNDFFIGKQKILLISLESVS